MLVSQMLIHSKDESSGIRILKWKCGYVKRNMIRNEDIRNTIVDNEGCETGMIQTCEEQKHRFTIRMYKRSNMVGTRRGHGWSEKYWLGVRVERGDYTRHDTSTSYR